VDALGFTKGNVAKAAKLLGSTQRVLGYKLKRYGIAYAEFRR